MAEVALARARTAALLAVNLAASWGALALLWLSDSFAILFVGVVCLPLVYGSLWNLGRRPAPWDWPLFSAAACAMGTWGIALVAQVLTHFPGGPTGGSSDSTFRSVLILAMALAVTAVASRTMANRMWPRTEAGGQVAPPYRGRRV